MNLLGDIFYGLGRFFRGLFTGNPERPTQRELEQQEREAEEDAREKLRERFR